MLQNRIDEIRHDIEENHWQCIEPFLGGRGGFGETFCGHIHCLDMTFKDQAEHYGITLNELAAVTADHIQRLDESWPANRVDWIRVHSDYEQYLEERTKDYNQMVDASLEEESAWPSE